MFVYGKTVANAIAIMSYLAVHLDKRVGSREIGEARSISKALTAKLLTQLATAGLVKGQPGPSGGYTLAKAPEEISLFQIMSLFEQTESPSLCPFGPKWCATGDPCPMHSTLVQMQELNYSFLQNTRLSIFASEIKADHV